MLLSRAAHDNCTVHMYSVGLLIKQLDAMLAFITVIFHSIISLVAIVFILTILLSFDLYPIHTKTCQSYIMHMLLVKLYCQ